MKNKNIVIEFSDCNLQCVNLQLQKFMCNCNNPEIIQVKNKIIVNIPACNHAKIILSELKNDNLDFISSVQ